MATPRRNPALWPLAALSLLLIGIPVVAAVRDALDDPADRIEVTEPVDAYQIDYRVEDLAGVDDANGGGATSIETLTVRRPFTGRIERRKGGEPDGDPLSVEISGFAARQHDQAGEDAFVVTVEPSPPGGDLRLDTAFASAVERGLLTFDEETRTILGRRCDVYRAPVLSPSGQEEGDTRRMCIDAGGLVLADELIVDGKILRRRTASTVTLNPPAGGSEAAAFAIDATPIHVDDGGGAIREVTSDSRNPDTKSFELPAGPDGFRHRGRFVITPAAPTPEGLPGGTSGRVVGVIDVWERGRDYLAVFNGHADNSADPFRVDPRARSIDLGPFRAETVVTLTGAEVRADLGEGRFVRVFGTLPLSRLVGIARRLEAVTDGDIVPVEPLPP